MVSFVRRAVAMVAADCMLLLLLLLPLMVVGVSVVDMVAVFVVVNVPLSM